MEKADLKTRFKAWWDGTEVAEVPALAAVTNPAAAAPPRLEVKDLTDRLAVMQDLWGPGFRAPGGSEFVVDLAAVLNLTNEKSMLDVGAGLAGPARAIAQKYGVWITGFEQSPEMAKAAEQLSQKTGLAKKVKVQAFDPEKDSLPANKFDAVWSKDILFSVKAKERIFGLMAKAAKPRGQLLLIDYVLSDDADERTPEIAAWINQERRTPAAWTRARYEKAMNDEKLDLRVVDDLSDRYLQFITDAWSRWREVVAAVDATAEKEPGRLQALRRALAGEADLWAQRFETLKSGRLKVLRFHAQKPAAEVTR